VSIFAYLELKEGRRWKTYLSAVFLGLSLKRLNTVHFHCAAPVAFALTASPMLLMDTSSFTRASKQATISEH